MEKEFINYEEALALKELGFDESCFTYWVNDGVNITFATTHNRSGWSMIGFKNNQMIKKAGLCTAPLYQQAFRWFRDKYGLRYKFEPTVNDCVDVFISTIVGWEFFKTIKEENAEFECLKKLIEIVKSK